jgi:hypothetical protein
MLGVVCQLLALCSLAVEGKLPMLGVVCQLKANCQCNVLFGS